MSNRRRGRRNNNRRQPQKQDDNHLFTAFESLLKECRRLQNRVRYLEDQLDGRFYEPSGYPDIDNAEIDGYDNYWEEMTRPARKSEQMPNIEITSASRRSTSDLYKEARDRHEKKQSERRQKAEDEPPRDTRSPEEILGEQRARFYVEEAKTMVAAKS